VSSVPTYASVAGGHVAEDIAEPVQIEDSVRDRVPNIFASSLSTYAVHQVQVENRAVTDSRPYFTLFVSCVPTYASVAGGHVAEDITEPVQIEDGAGNGIPTIFVNSLSTVNYALQCTKYKWRIAEN